MQLCNPASLAAIIVGDHPMHNYSGGGNREQYGHDQFRIMANIYIVDHDMDFVGIPPADDTPYYTMYPWN